MALASHSRKLNNVFQTCPGQIPFNPYMIDLMMLLINQAAIFVYHALSHAWLLTYLLERSWVPGMIFYIRLNLKSLEVLNYLTSHIG
jgi:hypothetical protein